MDPLTAPPVLAAIQGGVLVRSLIVAAVLITPYYLYKRRQVRQHREAAAGRPPDAGAERPAGPRLEDVIDAVPTAADSARAEGTATITVPAGVTVDGKEPPPGLVDALVRDALRRSGLVATAEVDTDAGRSIECRPAP